MVRASGATDGDLDIDRTLERSGGLAPRDPRDLVASQFAAAPRAICLLVDRSGSMSGHAVALAAVAAAAVVSARGDRLQLQRDRVRRRAAGAAGARSLARRRVASSTTCSPCAGTGRPTSTRALRVAAEQLESVAPGGREAILLSDGLHTKGADPLAAAGLIDTLHVLGTSSEPEAVAAGSALARRGRGRFMPAATLAQLTDAIAAVLA